MLTPRQIEIIRLVGEGLTNAEIGCRLGIAENTIKAHKRLMHERECPDGTENFQRWMYRMVAEIFYGADAIATGKARAEGYAAGLLDGEHRGYERGRQESEQQLLQALRQIAARAR